MRPREQYSLLLGLSSNGGPLSSGSRGETVQDSRLFRPLSRDRFLIVSDARQELHDGIIDGFWGATESSSNQEPRAIVMAGPPGAGKSTALPTVSSEVFDGQPFAVIDGDELKASLLRDAVSSGYYESNLMPLVEAHANDGARFFPMDFAGLVHRESMILHATLFEIGIDRRTNLVIDGTLAWRDYGNEILSRLTAAGYATQLIVDVEASRSEAEERVYRRWLDGHLDGIRTIAAYPDARPLGGRVVPSIAYDSIYENGTAKTLTNARSLAAEFDIPVMVFFPAREKKQPELVFDSAHGGTVTHSTTSGRREGRCSVCGHPIWSAKSLERGAGPDCAPKLP
jgi:hypothetical protein